MSWENRDYNREDAKYFGGSGKPEFKLALPYMSRLGWFIVLACAILLVLQQYIPDVTAYGKLTDFERRSVIQPWRWITYQYLHGGLGHFFFNMIGVYFFLPSIENRWGEKKALLFYTAGGIVAGFTFCLMALVARGNAASSLIGASGSVLALIGAAAAFYPHGEIYFFIFRTTIRMLATFYLLLYIFSCLLYRDLSAAAHLGGLMFGWLGPVIAHGRVDEFLAARKNKKMKRLIQSDKQEREQVDRILEKVHQQGMNSLSTSEKRVLKSATIHQQQRDDEMAKLQKKRSI